MAHYAFINEDNIVTEVIVGIDETELIEGQDPETWYGNLKRQTCKRTSYNGNIRGTYAGLGFTYHEEEDIFIEPQPFPSWTRVGSFWNAPVAYPNDNKTYGWNEETGSWNEVS
jgi:hypothetical protein